MHLRHRFAAGLAFASLACAAAVSAAEEPLPKADAILDQFVEATGGKIAYDRVHNEKWTGTFEFVGKGIKGTVTSYRAEPNQSVTIVELAGVGTIEDGTDGETAWTRSALQGPRIKQGDERAVTMREATFRAPVEWRKLYKTAETTGVENVNDQPCYKVVLTPNEGKPETRYFDKKTKLLAKVTMTLASPMGEIPAETTIGDYREENGLRAPRKVHQRAMGQEFLITIDRVDYNVEIPKNRFDVPADVKALVSK